MRRAGCRVVAASCALCPAARRRRRRGRRRRLPRQAGRRRCGSSIEGRETTEPLLTPGRRDRASGQPLSMVAGARDRRASVQPRPVRRRQRRRRRSRTAASRCATSWSRFIRSRGSASTAPLGAPGVDAGRAAPRGRRPLRRVAAARPRRRHDAHPRRRAARARLSARRDHAARRDRARARARDAGVHHRSRAAHDDRRRSRSSAPPTVRAPSCSRGSGCAPARRTSASALNARIERYIEERRSAATTRRRSCRSVRARRRTTASPT